MFWWQYILKYAKTTKYGIAALKQDWKLLPETCLLSRKGIAKLVTGTTNVLKKKISNTCSVPAKAQFFRGRSWGKVQSQEAYQETGKVC